MFARGGAVEAMAQVQIHIRPELARRILWEAEAVEAKFPGRFRLMLDAQGRPAWTGSVPVEGQPARVIVTYPAAYPAVPPILETTESLPPNCPHLLGRAGARGQLCWIMPGAAAQHRRWDPQRHTAATVMPSRATMVPGLPRLAHARPLARAGRLDGSVAEHIGAWDLERDVALVVGHGNEVGTFGQVHLAQPALSQQRHFSIATDTVGIARIPLSVEQIKRVLGVGCHPSSGDRRGDIGSSGGQETPRPVQCSTPADRPHGLLSTIARHLFQVPHTRQRCF